MVTVFLVAVAALGPLGHVGATLGVLAAVAGLALEGVFLERTARRQVMTVLPESEPAARQPLSESVT